MKFYFTGLPVHVSSARRIYPDSKMLQQYGIGPESFVQLCVRDRVIGLFPEENKDAGGSLCRLSQGRLMLPADWAQRNGIKSRKCVYLFCIDGGILISAHPIACTLDESREGRRCICTAAL